MNSFGSQGWECPKCGAVMAPHNPCCVNCRGKNSYSVNTTTGGKPDILNTTTIS